MTKTKIEWTDETWNPVTGCTKVSEGCKNCYAETIAKRFWGDRKFTDVQCHEDRLEQPLKWKRPRRIFVCSMSDFFHPAIPIAFTAHMFAIMRRCPQHTFQILTKRPGLARAMENDVGICELPNIWIGTTIESARYMADRVCDITAVPSAVTFVSFEPLLDQPRGTLAGIDWVIVGGESGPKARPMNPDWAREILRVCKNNNIPFFMKQMGGYPNKRSKLEDIPEDLRIREFPAP